MPWGEHAHTETNKYINKCKRKDFFFITEINTQEMRYSAIVLVWVYYTEVLQGFKWKALKQNKSSGGVSER